jgi:hypothetical protein
MVPPDAQRFFAKRMGATDGAVEGSHASMVSQPAAVAAFILKAARAVETTNSSAALAGQK